MSASVDSIRYEVLRKVAQGIPPGEIIAELCLAFEANVPGTIAGVTILDRTLRIFEHAIFPSLSPDYSAALRGVAVADKPGSCALAVYDGKTVISQDVASDTRFAAAWKELGLNHGLKSLVSIPAPHVDGTTLGTFVVAYPPEAGLQTADLNKADAFAELCGLVLTYRRNQLKHDLLIGELQHRMRNLFSTIGAVVYSTLKSHPEPTAFRQTFDGRLMALAKAHSLALESKETDLRQLLVEILAPYSIDGFVSIAGPKLLLTQEAAVAFSLAAHELATNAAKYGAFSRDGGSVDIEWDFRNESEAGPQFELRWREKGGPEVRAPDHQGYGQKTLHRSLASAFDGNVALNYLPGGLEVRIRAPHSRRLGVPVN